jgi:argininosuccinate lyase
MENNQKLWGGRFQKGLHEAAKQLSYSLAVDSRLVFCDLQVNLAQAKALLKAGILTSQEYALLEKCIHDLQQEFKNPNHNLFADDEDIHSCVERLLTARLGDLGKKIHTGKSRNDQVKTDLALFMKAEVGQVMELLAGLQAVLLGLAEQHVDTMMPGFTHLQPAQPVLLAHHLLAYLEQFKRDQARFADSMKRIDICPLGSGALAGNNYGLDRELIAQELGFAALSSNSMDAVSDRDFLVEFMANAAICSLHLSRFCEELVLWSSPIMNFIVIDDAFTTGSSIMPQKKNPDVAELIRGKTGRVVGNLVNLMMTLKGLPLTYNRDLQEDKEPTFDTLDTLKLCLINFTQMLGSITFNKEVMRAALGKGYLLATDFADFLVQKGMPFRQAHEVTGKVVLHAAKHNLQLEELDLETFKKLYLQITQVDLDEIFNYEKAIERKNVYGGTAKAQVQKQIARIKK